MDKEAANLGAKASAICWRCVGCPSKGAMVKDNQSILDTFFNQTNCSKLVPLGSGNVHEVNQRDNWELDVLQQRFLRTNGMTIDSRSIAIALPGLQIDFLFVEQPGGIMRCP